MFENFIYICRQNNKGGKRKMILRFIIAACIIGAILGIIFSNGTNIGKSAINGAVKGGCFAFGCIWRFILIFLLLGILIFLLF